MIKNLWKNTVIVVIVTIMNQVVYAKPLEGDALRNNIVKRLPSLNHAKMEALMHRVGKKVPKNFYDCLCSGHGGVGGHSNYGKGGCEATGVLGGHWTFAIPRDAGSWGYCINRVKYDDNSTIVDAIVNGINTFHKSYLPCAEASNFYDKETLANFYTGKTSLNYSRKRLISDMIAAIHRFEKESGQKITPGTSSIGAPRIAQSLDSGALPTGKEATLHAYIKGLAEKKRKKISPSELFYCALKATNGNVRDALLTSHAALYRDGAKKNKKIIEKYLLPIRNPEGYSDKKDVKVWNKHFKKYQYVSAKDSASHDQQGVWYHLFGMAALEFSDHYSIVPFLVTQTAAEQYKPEYAKQLASGFPMSKDCGKLSNYAIALENQVRTNMRRAPDPDKQCINYAGCAIGSALVEFIKNREELQAQEKREIEKLEWNFRPQ